MSTVDFERLYAGDPDPWRVASDWYERRKIDVVLACLRRERYALAWDVGCGTGELAARLAQRCDAVVATDASPRAVGLSAARCAALDSVEVQVSALPAVPEAVAAAGAELVVLSEVLYYLPPAERAASAAAVASVCAPRGDVLAVHWSERPEEALTSGLECHREFDIRLLEAGFGRILAHRDVEFTLTMWSRDVPETTGR